MRRWDHPEVDATFRIRRSYRNLGLGLLAGYLAWCAADLYVVLTDPHLKGQTAFAAMFVGIPLLMVGFSLLMLVAYWREELTIRGERVIHRGIIRLAKIDLGEVTEARWAADADAVTLRSGSTRLTVSLSAYEAEESGRIIRHLHAMLRPEVQIGWILFIDHRERRERRLTRVKPDPGEVLIGRNHWDHYFATSLVAACVIGIVLWRFMGGLRFLVAAPLSILILWGMSRAATPARGMISPRFVSPERPELARFIVFSLVWGLVGLIGVSIHQCFRPGLHRLVDASFIVGSVVWFAVLVIEGGRLERSSGRRCSEATDLAAKGRGEVVVDPWEADWR